MFLRSRKENKFDYAKLPEVSLKDLHPDFQSTLKGEHREVSKSIRVMVAHMMLTTGQSADKLGPAEVLVPEAAEALRYYAMVNSCIRVYPARRICVKLGYPSIFPKRGEQPVHPQVLLWTERAKVPSPATYCRSCMNFLRWLCHQIEFCQYKPHTVPMVLLQRRHLIKYRGYLLQRTRGEIKPTTAKHYFLYVLRWLRWLQDNNLISGPDVSGFRMPDSENRIRVLPGDSEVLQFLRTLQTKRFWAQYTTYFRLLIATGARPIELHNLIIGDLDYDSHRIQLQSKCGPVRLFPLSDELWLALVTHIQQTHPMMSPSDYVFVHSDGRPFNIDVTRNIFNRATKAAGVHIDGQTAFRHRVATEFLENGVDWHHAIYLLGHKTSNQLSRYQHIRTRQSTQEVNRVFRRVRLWGV